MHLGPLVSAGRTSDVYAYGADSVAKVLRPTVPAEWAAFEAELTTAVRSVGVRAPEVRDVLTIDGSCAVVFERVHGPSMWEQMLAQPSEVATLTRQLARVQHDIHRAGIPAGIPDNVDRCRRKIDEVTRLTEAERSEAHEILESLPRGSALLHGDLHPENVVMSEDGPIVIDWFDASIGHPLADVVRSTILMRPALDDRDLEHLPGGSRELLSEMLRVYVEDFADVLAGVDRLAAWEGVLAASRIAERTEVAEAGLLQLWDARTAASASALLTVR